MNRKRRDAKDKGWICWGEWLGTGKAKVNRPTINYCSYLKSRKLVRQKEIETSLEFKEWYKEKKLPDSIPSHPDRFYKKKGWISWPNFLGTKRKTQERKNDSTKTSTK